MHDSILKTKILWVLHVRMTFHKANYVHFRHPNKEFQIVGAKNR